ncbi:hypothetical protein [Novipirellula rosea]
MKTTARLVSLPLFLELVMNSTITATNASILALLITCQTNLLAKAPIEHGKNSTADEVDPFAPNPLVDRFEWREYLSIKGTLVSGADLVGNLSVSKITLSSGNEILTNDETIFVRQSPGQPSTPATKNDITVGTPISYEIDIQRSAAAQRIVVWQGFGPFRHKIYDERINPMVKSLVSRVKTGKRNLIELEHPAEPMQIEFASSKQIIPPGEPKLIQLDTPVKALNILSGDQKQAMSFEHEFDTFVVFRSFGSGAMIFAGK